MATPSRGHQAFAKPVGALCNLECRYCYYLKKRDLYPKGAPFRMSDELLEQTIVQQIESAPGRSISFVWHGGEPTLLGLDTFRRIVTLQRKYRPPGRRIANSLQTNGTLLDDDWCRFLAAEGFHVGLSLDGPEPLHDCYRVDKGGKGSHRHVMRAYQLLRRHRVLHDVLCVVHDQNVRQPLQVYRFFRQIRVPYLGLLPLVEPDGRGGVSDRSVGGEALGAFLCTIFDVWLRQDVGRMTVQLFEEAVGASLGTGPSLCIFRKTCGDVPVVEHNGDFFACDHFVDPDHRLGNICETPLTELLERPQQRAFGEAKWNTAPDSCRACEVWSMCHGGCPKDRIPDAPDGLPGLNHLCAGYKQFFTHVRARAGQVAALRRAGRRAERPTRLAADRASPRSPHGEQAVKTGRNAPCPCGSGLKHKRCCLGR